MESSPEKDNDYEIIERESPNSKGESESQYKSRLLSSKLAAKNTESEALTIRNRIALLEKEEQKVLKKIEGAKKQALEILSKKQRNYKATEEKEKTEEERQRELDARKAQIQGKKEEMRQQLKDALKDKTLTSRDKASEIKENMKVAPR